MCPAVPPPVTATRLFSEGEDNWIYSTSAATEAAATIVAGQGDNRLWLGSGQAAASVEWSMVRLRSRRGIPLHQLPADVGFAQNSCRQREPENSRQGGAGSAASSHCACEGAKRAIPVSRAEPHVAFKHEEVPVSHRFHRGNFGRKVAAREEFIEHPDALAKKRGERF